MAKSSKKQTRRAKKADELTFNFDSKQAFRAADVSDFLGALASDYKKMSSRDLVVVRLSTGSLLLILKDALEHGLEYVAAANTLLEFGLSISQLIANIKETSEENAAPQERRNEPLASVEKMLKTAAHANAALDVRLERSNGDKLLVRMRPIEIHSLRPKVDRTVRARRLAARRPKPKLDPNLRIPRSEILRLAGQSDQDPEILEAIANLLMRQGLEEAVLSIATELEHNGQLGAAAIFQSAARRRRGGQLVTT